MRFILPGVASVIVGGQFGSEAKGLAAAIVARTDPNYNAPGKLGSSDVAFPIIHTTNAGAQAGHTTVLEDGRKFVCYHLPTLGVMADDREIYLNAGSIIDPELLAREIETVAAVTGEGEKSLRERITVHPNAAVISQHNKDVESGAYMGGLADGQTTKIGSTMKGVGAALCDKIMRQPLSVARDHDALKQIVGNIGTMDLPQFMSSGGAVTIEIPQGTGLSINNSPFFPHCTSRDCWVGQGLTDAGIHPRFLGEVLMVQRTFPIRVGHVYGETPGGLPVKMGDSGRFYPDSHEMRWDEFPGIEPERTTVTNRVRRIANWSRMQYEDSLKLNQPTIVLTTFINYMMNQNQMALMKNAMENLEIKTLERLPIHLWSWGPRVDQVSTQFAYACGEADLQRLKILQHLKI